MGVHLGDTLTDFVTKWPTSTASKGRAHQPAAGLRTNGQLNPEWVEWLMGFPPGWTDCDPSETPSSRRSLSGSAADSLKPKGSK